jgi:DNA-binding CsgD family transcriptional regulator
LAEVTESEQEIINLIQSGINSPSEVAEMLGITHPGASQALAKFAEEVRVLKRSLGE